MFGEIYTASIFEYNIGSYQESFPLTDIFTWIGTNEESRTQSDVAAEDVCYTLSSSDTTVGFDISYKADFYISYVLIKPRLSQEFETLSASADAFSSNIEVSVTDLAGVTTVCGTLVDPTIDPIL